ncbi:MAG: integrin alpha, partial [Bacteroidota bacterium]
MAWLSAPAVGQFPAVITLDTLDGTDGFTLNGIDTGDQSGFSVSNAGDVNNDGFDDLIVGAYFADPNGNYASGETYVIFGQSSFAATLELSALGGSNGFTLNGIDARDQLGISVSSAGDVNNDGFDDMMVGAHYADPNGNSNSGETYVVFGQSSFAATVELSTLDGSNGFTLNGIDA